MSQANMAMRTGSPGQLVVVAQDVPVGDVSPQWRGLTVTGDGQSSPAGARSSQYAFGEWYPLMAWVHRLGGRGVQPSQWSEPTVCVWGMAAPNGTS